MISLIVACGRNNVIGRDGGLPWYLPADLKHFKSQTMGKPVVMGRKTYLSIGEPLPGRDNIVVSRDLEFVADGVTVTHSPNAALSIARSHGDEVMVIGGSQIYEAVLPLADRIYMTRIEFEPEGDVFFPAIDERDWKMTVIEEHQEEDERPAFSFLQYDRVWNLA